MVLSSHYIIVECDGDLRMRCNAQPTLHEFPECWYTTIDDSSGELDYEGDLPSECNTRAWFDDNRFVIEPSIFTPVGVEWNYDEDEVVITESLGPADHDLVIETDTPMHLRCHSEPCLAFVPNFETARPNIQFFPDGRFPQFKGCFAQPWVSDGQYTLYREIAIPVEIEWDDSLMILEKGR